MAGRVGELMRKAAWLLILCLMLAACTHPRSTPLVPTNPATNIPGTAENPIDTTPPGEAPATNEASAAPPTIPPPTATPFIPTLVALTQPGCCAFPFWSND